MILQELYPDMYKLHETNQTNSEPEKREGDERTSEKEGLVDVGREGGEAVCYGDILDPSVPHPHPPNRYITDHQFEDGTKTSEMVRYLMTEDYCERYQERYSDIANQDLHHRLVLEQRDRVLPVEMFHKMKNINQ